LLKLIDMLGNPINLDSGVVDCFAGPVGGSGCRCGCGLGFLGLGLGGSSARLRFIGLLGFALQLFLRRTASGNA
jgi:hypothetical protein